MKTKPEIYVETRPGVRGAAPVIAGTGIKVLDVAVRYEVMDMRPEEIMVALPHLEWSQIHAALSYDYAHKAGLDREWKASLKKVVRLRAGKSSIFGAVTWLGSKSTPMRMWTCASRGDCTLGDEKWASD